ncbi:MAG: 5-methylcytosine-specific restriction protein B, partial [Oleiphilaceae bacterium]
MSITEKQHLWNEFLARWPREKLADLTLQQYVSVNDQDTFTYWLETKTRDLGSIQGNTSAKFGIYKRGSDGKEQSGIGHGEIYSWRTRYGIDEKSVFTYVKDALVTIANAAYEGDLQTIEALDFAPLVKWKIAFLYQNQQAPVMINTFSGPMLQVLTDSTANTPYPEMYQKLINNKGQRNLLEYGAACWLDANNKKASVERQSILNHFTQIRSFKAGLSRWSEDTITAFCEVISEAHVKKLDIFITDMASGGMIRIGRKELDQNRAKEVFATFEPTLSKIKFEQRFLKRPNYFCTDVDSDLIKTINESNQLIEFSQQYPITRKPYWPDNYGDSDLDDGQELTSLETHVQEPKGIYQMQTSPLNQIFYGPPGTGKTYHTVEAAVKAAEPEFKWHNRDELKAEYDRLVAKKRIRFVTFHQSYGYEEFVEGLKAKTTEDKSIEYVVENGAFKSIADDAKSTAFRKSFEVSSDATIWKISIDGTGKSEVSNHCLANGVAAIGWGDSGNLLSEKLENNEYYQKLGPQVKSSLSEFSQRAAIGDLILCIGSQRTVQAVGVISGDYHYEPEGTSIYRSYCNQLPVNWLVTDIQIDFHALNNGVNFTQKTFYELWRFSVADVFELLSQNDIHIGSRQAESRETENYVLIIDEINRGNISKIFGELITLIEPSKRSGYNQKEALTLNLPYSGKPFSVPNNLHIIGTMNTADRSLALMDTALRRRFDFIEMMPNYDVFREHGVLNVEGVKVDLAELLKTMNQRIEVLYDRE